MPPVGPAVVLGACSTGEDCWGEVWPVLPWVWLGEPPVAVPERVAPGAAELSADGPLVAPWVGVVAADGLFLRAVAESCGSGEPGSSLRGASPGPGTMTRSASRTAPPSTEPTRSVRPMTIAVMRAPRRRT